MVILYNILCLCLALLTGSSFQTAKLAYIGKQIPESYLYTQDSIFSCPQVIKGKSLIIKHDRSSSVSHLGISLFSEETKELINAPACNFIERFLLELVLLKSDSKVMQTLKHYNISMQWNGFDFGSNNFHSITDFLERMGQPCEFGLVSTSSQFVAKWNFEVNQSFKISFPASRELIFGSDKKESDEEINMSLRTYTPGNDIAAHTMPTTARLLLTGNPYIYRNPGNSFSINQLRSDTYYSKKGDTYIAISDAAYPQETIINMLLGKVGTQGHLLHITHKIYGNFTPIFNIPVSDFINYFQSNFISYAAVEITDIKKIRATLVLHNPTYNYIHMLIIDTTTDDLFKDSATLEAHLYTNIPQHYIKSLFGEQKSNN